MTEYLKMADVFVGELVVTDRCYIATKNKDYVVFNEGDMGCTVSKKAADYAVHAINHHDSLVAEVERLREFLGDCREFIEYVGNKNGFGNGDINKILNSINQELKDR